MHHLYDTKSGTILWSGSTPYTVDGKPGEIPDGWVQIEDQHTDPPAEVPAGKVAQAYTEIDVEGRTRRHLWRLVDAPIGPVTKLTIKKRVRAAEWEALKLMLASARTSAVDAEREIAEEWDEASVIDPEDPKTQAVLESLTARGVLTTPIRVIFQAS